MPLSGALLSADSCSPRWPHSSLCLLSSQLSDRGLLHTKPTRRNLMSHEELLRNSQEQLSTSPAAASHSETRPAGNHFHLLWFVTIPLTLCVIGLFTLLSKSRTQSALAASTQATVAEPVSVLHPRPGDLSNELVLPATLQAFSDAPIYARTSGYVAHWYADIGQHVSSGQVLAQIESPDVDQQLIRARAALN